MDHLKPRNCALVSTKPTEDVAIRLPLGLSGVQLSALEVPMLAALIHNGTKALRRPQSRGNAQVAGIRHRQDDQDRGVIEIRINFCAQGWAHCVLSAELTGWTRARCIRE